MTVIGGGIVVSLAWAGAAGLQAMEKWYEGCDA
jgi:hypothetical protein